jgi:signal transduction histidine kinase
MPGPPLGPTTTTLDAEALLEINRLRLVARVVSNVAHDINNALQVISGSAELLAPRSELGQAEQRRIQTISTQTARAAMALDRLSAYSRADRADPQVVDLSELAETAVALRDFTLHGARVAVTIEGAVPPYRASVGRSRILQVFLNVLLNAEEALKNRRDGTIHITVSRSGADCEVSFADNGPGIDGDAPCRLNDPVVLPPLGPGLTGIGLWVSAWIAAQHHGRLDIGPPTGSGTSVTLVVPAA